MKADLQSAARWHDQRAAEAERDIRQLFDMILQPGGVGDMTGIIAISDRVKSAAIVLHVHRESARHFRSEESK